MSMTLSRLLDDPGAPGLVVTGLASDSRRVRPGDVFFAYQGTTFDGHRFAREAVAAGAVAVVSERPVQAGVPNVVLAEVGQHLGAFANRFFETPSRELDVVGITGTNGKTTVAYNIARVVQATGYLGTLGWGRPPALCAADMTTSDPITLVAHLRALKGRGCARVALEVSSHALDQDRVDALDFAVGVFTNLSRDHLDYHGSMARYGEAKKRLFARPLRAAVVNVDDALGQSIVKALPTTCETVSVGAHAAVRWVDVDYGRDGIAGEWRTPWGNSAFALPGFYGEFSVYNAATTLAACCVIGMPLGDVVDGMAMLDAVPGRMEVVAQSPRVIVDYAHTPDGIQAALAAVRSHLACGGRVIVVFGCGGDRDRGKRAAMARAAEAGADLVVATSDNPRTEAPERILDDIETGFRSPADALRIVDRREAITVALTRALEDDVVLVAGKGHERYQEIGAERIPFSDTEVVRAVVGES